MARQILRPGQKPTAQELKRRIDLILKHMKQQGCEFGRMHSTLNCTTAASNERLQLQIRILNAEINGRPLDPQYIRDKRKKIEEREKACLQKANSVYQRCTRGAG